MPTTTSARSTGSAIVVANMLANYYGQFKEAAQMPLVFTEVRPEHKVSGLLGPVTLRVMR